LSPVPFAPRRHLTEYAAPWLRSLRGAGDKMAGGTGVLPPRQSQARSAVVPAPRVIKS